MTILDSMSDPNLFGPWFQGSSWNAWRAFLAACFGLPMNEAQLAVYRQHTGRKTPPTEPAGEAWIAVGRRGGKSAIAGLIATYLAAFRDYRPHLGPGEVATVMVLACDRAQARVIFRYVRGLLAVPMLERMIVGETRQSITLANRVCIEIHTSSYQAVRGYSIAAALCDETAFWPSDQSTNPAGEVVSALRPALATFPGSLLLGISTPYSRRGILWENFKRYCGKGGAPVLTWQAPSLAMNPTLSQKVIDQALETDEAAARSEWLAEFRSDLETYVSREVVEAAIVPGRYELPPAEKVKYFGFTDPSGGSRDSFTLAVAHHDGERIVLDAIRERRPPFSPEAVVAEFAELVRSYHVARVDGDRYAGEWPREQFAKHGVECRIADKTKSELYAGLLPLLNSGRVELLDNPRLVAQLTQLERRTSRGGKDNIDHPPRGHDDVVNAAAGAVSLVAAAARHPPLTAPIEVGVRPSPWRPREWWT